MKSFFIYSDKNIKKSFSKQSQSNALRKFGKYLQTAGPIIETGSGMISDAAPMALAMGPMGVPVAVGMKAVGAAGKVTGKAYQMGGDAAVRDARKMAPQHRGIQAPKPEDNGPDNVFY